MLQRFSGVAVFLDDALGHSHQQSGWNSVAGHIGDQTKQEAIIDRQIIEIVSAQARGGAGSTKNLILADGQWFAWEQQLLNLLGDRDFVQVFHHLVEHPGEVPQFIIIQNRQLEPQLLPFDHPHELRFCRGWRRENGSC